MDFSDALVAVTHHRARVARTGWTTTGKWIFFVPGSTITVSADRPLGQAAPEMVGNSVRYRPHIDVKTADGEIGPWIPSQADLLATDWEVVTDA